MRQGAQVAVTRIRVSTTDVMLVIRWTCVVNSTQRLTRVRGGGLAARITVVVACWRGYAHQLGVPSDGGHGQAP